MDPIAMLQSEGFAYWKASRSPRKLIVVIGMWMLFGPTLLFVPCALLAALMSDRFETPLQLRYGEGVLHLAFAPLALLYVGGMLWISGTLLYRTTTNYRNRKPETPEAPAD